MGLRDHLSGLSYSATLERSPEAVAAIERGALDGDAMAQHQWAEHLYWGLEATYDRKQAFAGMQKAAAQDFAPAVLFLGLMHQYVEGTRDDAVAALAAYRRAGGPGSGELLSEVAPRLSDEEKSRAYEAWVSWKEDH